MDRFDMNRSRVVLLSTGDVDDDIDMAYLSCIVIILIQNMFILI